MILGAFVKFVFLSNRVWGVVTFVEGDYLELELANQPMMPTEDGAFVPVPGVSEGDQVIIRKDSVLEVKE
ncbi:MAG: hypothetical protein AAFW60_01850 [Pseudomonadota bacterium]